MNALSLENINRQAPYQVEQVGESPYLFYFLTDYGVEYEIFIKTAEGTMEGQMNFMAIISRRDNPNLQNAIEEFDETTAFLFD